MRCSQNKKKGVDVAVHIKATNRQGSRKASRFRLWIFSSAHLTHLISFSGIKN